MTGAELEEKLARGELKRIGDGSRRICYAIGDTGLCLKGYRREGELDSRMRADGTLETYPLKSSTIREIRAARFDERRNTSCQEWRYYQELKVKLPQELFAAFPETLERVSVPSLGWFLVENLIVKSTPTARLSGSSRPSIAMPTRHCKSNSSSSCSRCATDSCSMPCASTTPRT